MDRDAAGPEPGWWRADRCKVRLVILTEDADVAYLSEKQKLEIIMKITLSTSTPSQFETECLVVAVVDVSEKTENGADDKPKPQILTDDAAVLCRCRRPGRLRRSHGQSDGSHTPAQTRRTQGEAPAADRWRKGEDFLHLRAAQDCGRRCAYRQREGPEELRHSLRPATATTSAPKTLQSPSSKVPMLAPLMPTTTRAIARNKRSTSSRSSLPPTPTRNRCRPRSMSEPSSARRRTSPATWSTSPAIA